VKIQVNGESIEFEGGLTVTQLFVQLKIDSDYRAVAINREIVPRNDYDSTKIVDGDKIEIVRPVSGG